ncbi:Six-hairpin glycosidase-like protein [Kockovaella imperatae]|uniref:Six-hairpin glycosidase-like protein n=1 Tax=Kockovaella imperatae TaxID=4999 RepID=A0A1Y1UE27_9TREE|nr:Six-hairpin glycosidase-like protein [Kockovaella imperatae]ORX36272.1 Six-hairpin glycosidase-like protein [Kockovaella imperatae]
MVDETLTNGDSHLAAESSLPVDLKTIPWSRRGSYMSFSTLAGDCGALTPNIDVALVSHYKPYGAPCFVLRPKIEPLPSPSGFHKTPSPVTFRATPELLEWRAGSETVAEATFISDNVVRLRGTTPMSFDTDMEALRSYIYEPPKPTAEARDVVEWSSIGLMPLRFVALEGSLSTIGATTYENGRITIHPGATGHWDLFIRERCPSEYTVPGETIDEWADRISKRSFNTCVESVQREFESYARGLCTWSGKRIEYLDLLACYVMWTSTVRAEGFINKEAVLMSKLWMNKVWSWDNCFNALALAGHSGLLQSGIDNLLLPFSQQLEDGRIPDAMMYNELTFDFTKPPIFGWTLERLLKMRPEVTSQQLLDIYRKVSKFTFMWLKHRRVQGSKLPFYSHGNDSGWDNSTSFDGQRVIVNADLASHLILQSDVLSRISAQLRLGEEGMWSDIRDELVDALLSELWDGEHFRVKNAITGETRKSTSLLQYVPLTASRFLPKEVVDKMVADLQGFLTPWGLATEPIDSKEYDSDGYWRGPIWAPSTILLESGVREAGYVEFADDLRRRFFKLCQKGSFAENYDAVTGEGHRDLSHTWSSAIFLIMRREAAEAGEL